MSTQSSIPKLWHVELAVVIAIGLQLFLPEHVSVGPKYLIAILEVLLLVGLRLSTPHGSSVPSHIKRLATVTLTALVSVANIVSLVLVCRLLIDGGPGVEGKKLLVSAVSIYITNIIVFALWYWQLDGGGSGGRGTNQAPVDFLFPQMGTSDSITQQPHWQPTFFDYFLELSI